MGFENHWGRFDKRREEGPTSRTKRKDWAFQKRISTFGLGGVHAAPSTGRPLLCEREKIKAGMRNKLRKFRDAGRPMLGDRTDLVLLAVMVLLVADVRASWEVLGDVRQLEASMQSTMQADLREAEAGMLQPSGLQDSSAVVGRVFQMQVPVKAKGSGSKVKVRGSSFEPQMCCKCMLTNLSSRTNIVSTLASQFSSVGARRRDFAPSAAKILFYALLMIDGP